jgi:hypothetical protein
MQTEEILWKVNQPEKVLVLLRAYKHLATIDEVITILIRPKRIDFFSESQDNSTALICTFNSSYFNGYQGTRNGLYAVFSRNLMMITETNKTSIVSIMTKIRRNDYLDLFIEYNTGVVASYGCPFTDKIHEICQAGGPELPLYPSWIGDHHVFWDEKMMKLFPGSYEFLAIKLTSNGIEVRNFDYEKNQTGVAGHPIKIPRAKIQVYEPQKEIEMTSIPFSRLKTFMESAKKCKFSVQMSPEYGQNTSQAYWQCFDEKKNVYFTLLLGCDIEGEKSVLKHESQEDYDIRSFRQLD